MKYKLLLLDLDGTILDYKESEKKCLKKLFEDIKIPYKNEYLDIYSKVNSKYWTMLENNEITREDLINNRFKNFFDEINVKINIDANKRYLYHLSKSTDMIDNSIKLLEKLYEKIDIIAATNGIKYVQESRIEITNIKKYFKEIITSEEAGYQKPHKNYFKYCLKDYKNINKKDILMVGDSLNSDIKGAINYGIDSCWFNPNNKTTELKPNYIINDLYELIKIVF